MSLLCAEQMNQMMRRKDDRQEEDVSVNGQQRALMTTTMYGQHRII